MACSHLAPVCLSAVPAQRSAYARGTGYLGAIERLGHSLHPAIESVRSQFLLGEYELLAFAAMRAIEVRVRELAGYGNADIGTPMMRKAFHAQDGPLSDPTAEGGERQGLFDLYAGAFSVFKNPTSHRVVTFEDPTEAAEVISLASLLLRILDRHRAETIPASRSTIIAGSLRMGIGGRFSPRVPSPVVGRNPSQIRILIRTTSSRGRVA